MLKTDPPIFGTDPRHALRVFGNTEPGYLYAGKFQKLAQHIPDNSIDAVITSPPYYIGKEYDASKSIEDYKKLVSEFIDLVVPKIKVGGSIAWQVGNHVSENSYTPLDIISYNLFADCADLRLQNRIIWHFGHGTHSKKRFSGRHETVLWFTKGTEYYFDLDAVRVPQKYPGKRHYKGPNLGKPSGNPLGKNPGDVWEIPNVKAKHVEKTAHPCQFPVGLVDRLVRAFTPPAGVVLDPFMGAGSTAVASELRGRRWVGAEPVKAYCNITQERISNFRHGHLLYRDVDVPVAQPNKRQRVARLPDEWINDETTESQ